ncbi:GMC family oxidoreductase [Streptomyces sp. NBC_00572]|uniref:GMC family oxidoreductase n=1 Tax=Streptomyces sp. NBC_00572 TaxID=2903664 RepID=UPI002259E7CC|nr:GMC family oxidoreductase [Streptomyces sp. NBC_00572]MCX4986522.1 GMC family oxidoreductase [Streptomyces sp. NBC_00572]
MTRYDVIVVGAGVAGSLVAHRIGRLGRRVLVLEAGTAGTAGTASAAGPPDATGAAGPGHEGEPASDPPSTGFPFRPHPAAPWPEVSDLAGTDGIPGYRASGHLRQDGPLPYASGYVRVNGGTGNVWTGLAPRMLPEDFDTEPFGYGRRWPLTYDELEPHYRAAEEELGVAADADEQREHVGLPFPDDYAFPMRALPAARLDRVLSARLDGRRVKDPVARREVELRVVGTPHARNGVPDPRYDAGRGYVPRGRDGRPDPDSRCVGSASCIPHCPSYAKYTPLKTQGRWSATVTLRDRSVVSRVLVDASGRATGVEYRSYDGKVSVAHADVVVLAAHAVENARLLLLSGLADRSGQVGRNLMDHPVLLTWGLLPEDAGPYRGPGSVSGFEGFRAGPARRLRAPFRVEFGTWGWIWAKGPVDTDVHHFLAERGLFGAELRRAVGDRIRRQFTLQFEMEQSADPSNRVTLHPHERDALGLPRPLVTYDLDEHVREGMVAARAVSDQIFELLGAEDHTDYAPVAAWPGRFEHGGRAYGYRGAGHAAGTHIMGDSPATSVVDGRQRCWDHPGLYAVGCGSMPSVATSNPTLTMAALALRSAEHIEADLASRDRPVTLAPPPPPSPAGETSPTSRGASA